MNYPEAITISVIFTVTAVVIFNLVELYLKNKRDALLDTAMRIVQENAWKNDIKEKRK